MLVYIVIILATVIVIALISAPFLWKKIKEQDAIKYEFVTIVTHKFRTPLTQIKWTTEFLLLSEQDKEKHQSLLDLMEATDKLIGLTGSLVDVLNVNNWKSVYAFEDTSLCELVRGIAEQFEVSFKKSGIAFSLVCPPTDIMAKIDKERMKHVIQILLENANNYTPQGGKVIFSIEEIHGKACISVSDTGIGIQKSDMSRLFTKFFRANNAIRTNTEGFGIGLFLAQSVVKRHKGKIKVYSEGENRGTTFTIVLPKSEPVPLR